MIYKLLLTIGVIIVVALVFRNKGGKSGQNSGETLPVQTSFARPVRIAAVITVVVMLATASLWVLLSWRDATTVVTVKVVNSSSGVASEFQAHRGDVDDRSFRTLDGRTVVLADVERLEISDQGQY